MLIDMGTVVCIEAGYIAVGFAVMFVWNLIQTILNRPGGIRENQIILEWVKGASAQDFVDKKKVANNG